MTTKTKKGPIAGLAKDESLITRNRATAELNTCLNEAAQMLAAACGIGNVLKDPEVLKSQYAEVLSKYGNTLLDAIQKLANGITAGRAGIAKLVALPEDQEESFMMGSLEVGSNIYEEIEQFTEVGVPSQQAIMDIVKQIKSEQKNVD